MNWDCFSNPAISRKENILWTALSRNMRTRSSFKTCIKEMPSRLNWESFFIGSFWISTLSKIETSTILTLNDRLVLSSKLIKLIIDKSRVHIHIRQRPNTDIMQNTDELNKIILRNNTEVRAFLFCTIFAMNNKNQLSKPK